MNPFTQTYAPDPMSGQQQQPAQVMTHGQKLAQAIQSPAIQTGSSPLSGLDVKGLIGALMSNQGAEGQGAFPGISIPQGGGIQPQFGPQVSQGVQGGIQFPNFGSS